MDYRSYAPEQEVTEGIACRRIPNWDGYFDHDEGVPDISAFVPSRRAPARGLSAYLDRDEALATLEEHEGFGLVALDIEKMRTETAGRVSVRFTPTSSARSHVSILGVVDDELRLILASISEVVVPPERLPTPPGLKHAHGARDARGDDLEILKAFRARRRGRRR